MPGGGALGVSTADVRASTSAGGASGWPAAFGTGGCAPVTCVAGGFAGEGGTGEAAAGSGALGAGVDLQDRTARQRRTASVRMDPRENGTRILRGGARPAQAGVAVCVAACAFSGSAIRTTWETSIAASQSAGTRSASSSRTPLATPFWPGSWIARPTGGAGQGGAVGEGLGAWCGPPCGRGGRRRGANGLS